MKTRIRNLISFVLLSAASLTLLFGSPNTQPSGTPQTEPEVSVPSIVKPGSDKGAMRTRADTLLPSARYRAQIDLNQPSVTLEQLDIRSFTLEPNQIGVNRSVEVSPNTRAQKFLNPDGSQVIALIIKSSDASGIGVHFRNFALAEGEEVYVYGTAPDSIVFGPYTNEGPWGSGEFWSGTVDGDTAVIEFYTRTDKNEKGFEVFEVSHIFTERDWRLRSNQPDVEPCEVDASCNPVSEKNAVGRILFNVNGNVYVCTGTLLNDVVQDHCPYFLTANHCVATQAVAQTVEVYWFYQTTGCNSGVLRNDWGYSPPGANLLATQSSNNFSLLRLLSDVPGGAWFSGWNANAQPTGTAVFGLHHPDIYIPGDPQIDSYLRRSDGSIIEANASWYETHWTSGTTEGGSDGSGLFTSNGHYLVGVLSNYSTDPCAFPDSWYSKFANFYPQIQPYIGSNPPRTSPPLATAATLVTGNSFKANWKPACSATSYRLDVATNNSFTNYVPGYQNLDVGNVTSRSVSILNPNTTYYYRVRAFNSAGISGNSNVISVRTRAIPVVSTLGALFVTTSSATLTGQVNTNGLRTDVWFEYGETTNYEKPPTPHQIKTGGNINQPVSANITNLDPETRYHFRIRASNIEGEARGADATFTTFRPFNPTVTTDPATNVANSSARLNGRVNPQGLSTTVRFQYGKTLSYELGFTDPQTRTGNTNQSVFANIPGPNKPALSANTTYHFRIRAQHIPYPPVYGYDRTFRTLSPTGPPVVTTNPATNVASSSATLNGTVYPHGLSTTVWFKWGRTTNYELGPTPNQTKVGNNYQNVSANISGLSPNITYHFRVCADNTASEPVCDGDRTFTTLGGTGPPTVTTNPATNVTGSSATLNGTVNPHGLSTTVYFQYGETTSYGRETLHLTKTGNTVQNVSANISNLLPGRTYHFRLVGINQAGRTNGSDRTFTTTPSVNCDIAGTWAGTVSRTLHYLGCTWTGTSSFSMVITETDCGPPPPPNVGPCYEGSANWRAACLGPDCQPTFYNITGDIYVWEYQYNNPCNDFAMEFHVGTSIPCWLDYSLYEWMPVRLSQDGNTLRCTTSGATVNLTRQ